MNKLMTFPDIKEDIKNGDYKRVCLADKNGQILVPFNPRNEKIEIRLGEIERRLKSVAMKPGVYQVHAKHWINSSTPAIYYVGVGSEKDQLADIVIETEEDTPKQKHLPMVAKGETVSWDKYQELYLQNLENLNTITRLELEIDNLNQELDELYEELENEPEGGSGFLSDGDKQWFGQLAEMGLPLLDKFMDQRDKKLNLMANEMYLRYGPPPGHNQAHPKNQPLSDDGAGNGHEEEEEGPELSEREEIILTAMENMKETNPGLYQEMMSKLDSYYEDGEDD